MTARRVLVLCRDAITGRWVSALYARLHPATTVRETRPDPFAAGLRERPPLDDQDAR